MKTVCTKRDLTSNAIKEKLRNKFMDENNFRRLMPFYENLCWHLAMLAAASLIFLINFPNSIESQLDRGLKNLIFLAITAIFLSLVVAFFRNIFYMIYLAPKGAQPGPLRDKAHRILYILIILSIIFYIVGLVFAIYVSISVFDLFPFSIYLKEGQ